MTKIKKAVISVVSVLLGLIVLFGILRGITGSWNPKNWGDSEMDLSAYVLKTEYDELKSEYGNLKTKYDEVNAKVLYSLGEFDTYESNGDGTVTIRRQTGYIKLDGSENWKQEKNAQSVYRYLNQGGLVNYINGASNVDINLVATVKVVSANQTWGYNISLIEGVGIQSNGMFVIYMEQYNEEGQLDEFKQYLSVNPVYVQYLTETSYIEIVTEKQSIWG